MAKTAASPPLVADPMLDWTPLHPAVERELQLGSDGRRHLAQLRHPNYPFCGRVSATHPDADLFALALSYLQRLATLAVVADDPAGVGSGHMVDARPGFAALLAVLRRPAVGVPCVHWLDLAWGGGVDDARRCARSSFWVERQQAERRLDRSAVLLAGWQWRAEAGGRQSALGGGAGLRVVVQVAAEAGDDGCCAARITSISLAGLPWPADLSMPDASVQRLRAGFAGSSFAAFQQSLAVEIARTLGLQANELIIERFTPGVAEATDAAANISFALAGTAVQGRGEAARVVTWQGVLPDHGAGFQPHGTLQRLRSHAARPPGLTVLHDDPGSCGPAVSQRERRPTRPDPVLNAFRAPSHRLPPNLPQSAAAVPIKRLANPFVQVMCSPLVLPGCPASAVQTVDAQAWDLRSDELAAVQAYLRGQELMARLSACGLQPQAYFRLAALPLVMRHHAAVRGAADGDAVNAETRPLPQAADAGFGLLLPGQRPLELRFAAASLSHRQRDAAPQADGRWRVRHLGLAADPRWAWHEFGHVIAFAATGEIEFRFAHSVGDALAAVIADPDSQLADDAAGQRRNEHPMRFVTFSWVTLGRRHDRPALRGWCWCGQRNRRRLQPSVQSLAYTGYFAEQLLSSSLFRLYRAIGGDSADAADRDLRHSAAHYTVYLILRATALLGPATVVPAQSVDQFVTALIDADIGSADWDGVADWPEAGVPPATGAAGPPAPRPRRGGMVHKVIRWAFEQQGLYATTDPGAIAEGPGQPPLVDVFIPGPGARSNGDYAPLSLAWIRLDSPADWHADSDAIRLEAGLLRVQVGNRGLAPATGLVLTVWLALLPAAGAQLQWLGPLLKPAADIGPGGRATLALDTARAGLQPPCAAAPWLVLAMVSARGDLANADAQAGLCCAITASAMPPVDLALLTDLVANDNNAGLRLLCG